MANRLCNVFVVIGTEACALSAEEVLISSCRCIRMQEYTVLDHMPLGIDCDTAFRHCAERILRRTCIINIPTVKYIAGRCMCSIRLVVVIVSNTCTILDIPYSTDLPLVLVPFFNFISVTVYIDSIHEVDRIDITGIVAINMSCILIFPYGIQFRTIFTISLGRIGGAVLATFCKSNKFYIVLSLCKMSVLCIYALILNKAHPIVGSCSRLTGKSLYIIVNSLCGSICHIQMECHISTRHYVYKDQYLFVRGVALRIPTFAMVVCRAIISNDGEVCRDILLI